MSAYREHVVPRLTNCLCGMPESAKQRRRVCEGLSGEVVEIGFGSGHNVPFYPSAITRVAAVEPSDVAWKLAGDRVAASPVPVERAGLDGQALPFADGSFDAALSTWTMCTIPDVAGALAELHRVLRPGGELRFVEHGLAPDARVQQWQRRVEPLQKRVFGGCHLTRRIPELVTDAGFAISELDAFYEPGSPKIMGATSLGAARRP